MFDVAFRVPRLRVESLSKPPSVIWEVSAAEGDEPEIEFQGTQGRSCPPQGWIFSPEGEVILLVEFSVRPSVLLNSRVFTHGGERRG
jgi:hypothetical protein